MQRQLIPVKPTFPRRQRGVTLIESLVAILVAALGILGILGVQMRTLTDTQTSTHRAQAVALIQDLSERLTVNPNALQALDSYASAFNDNPTAVPTACAGTACDRTALASYDLAMWKQAVRNALPLGQASIFLAPGEGVAENRRLLGVMVAWRQNERADADIADPNKTFTNAIDDTQVLQDDGTFASATGGVVNCPTNFSCQLQYIPVAARCAPYFPGGGAIAYYCPGP